MTVSCGKLRTALVGMKSLIILSLAAICLAGRRNNDRKAFLFPGQPSSGKGSHTLIWSEFGNVGSVNPEANKDTEKSSEDSVIVLSNPNRRDVKLERGFPIFTFRGASKQLKNKAIKSEDPSFIENTAPVLEKEDSSSSEESQSEDQQQDNSSSEESSQSFSQSESSSEENSEPAVNQEVSSGEENNAEVVEENESSSKETNAPNFDQEAPKNGEFSEQANGYEGSFKFGFHPTIGANVRAQENRIREDDKRQLEKVKRVQVLGYRSLRSAELSIPDLGINLRNEGERNVQGPKGRLGIGKLKKGVRKPVKQ